MRESSNNNESLLTAATWSASDEEAEKNSKQMLHWYRSVFYFVALVHAQILPFSATASIYGEMCIVTMARG